MNSNPNVQNHSFAQQPSPGAQSFSSSITTSPDHNMPTITPEYYQELLKDKRNLQSFPNVFHHVERILETEIGRARSQLFHQNGSSRRHNSDLPEPEGPIVTVQEKVFVPVKENPNYNFVGRLLGPRGMTAKQLETDLDCKIMVRGKGSMRDKKKEELNRGKPNWEHLSEDLHVLISVEDHQNRAEIKAKRAAEEIRIFLEQAVKMPESEDRLKQMQLMEVAAMNEATRASNAANALSMAAAAAAAAQQHQQLNPASFFRLPTTAAAVGLTQQQQLAAQQLLLQQGQQQLAGFPLLQPAVSAAGGADLSAYLMAAAAAAATSAAAAAAASTSGSHRESSSQLAAQPPVSITVHSPDYDEDIVPDDSVSMAGRNLDEPDGDAIMIEQAMQSGRFGSPSGSQVEEGLRPPRPMRSNLMSVDTASRESLASNVSETDASYVPGLVPSGEVEVNLQYNYKERRFTVNVVQCRNLNALNGNPPNPYVKTYLLPDKTKRSKRRTQTRRATANPIYSEQLVYDIVKSELETRTLQVSVWHSLTFGSNVFLGEARVPMENYRFDAGPEVLKLGHRVEIPVPLPTLMYRGDIMLALRYVSGELIRANQLARNESASGADGPAPSSGRLEVWVQNCRNLAGSGSGASPYVKGYLINPETVGRGGRAGRDSRVKQKSAIVKGDMNPNFNSILAFENVSLRDLKERSLELTVWDYVKIGRNDFLGGVRLNIGNGEYPCMDARGHESLMWTRMLEKPNDWVEGSLLLRPSMDPRLDTQG